MYSFPRLINLWGAPHRPVLPYLSLHSSSLQPPILVRQKMGLTWDLLGTHLGLTWDSHASASGRNRECDSLWITTQRFRFPGTYGMIVPSVKTALSRISNTFHFLQFLQITEAGFSPCFGAIQNFIYIKVLFYLFSCSSHVTVICKSCKIQAVTIWGIRSVSLALASYSEFRSGGFFHQAMIYPLSMPIHHPPLSLMLLILHLADTVTEQIRSILHISHHPIVNQHLAPMIDKEKTSLLYHSSQPLCKDPGMRIAGRLHHHLPLKAIDEATIPILGKYRQRVTILRESYPIHVFHQALFRSQIIDSPLTLLTVPLIDDMVTQITLRSPILSCPPVIDQLIVQRIT